MLELQEALEEDARQAETGCQADNLGCDLFSLPCEVSRTCQAVVHHCLQNNDSKNFCWLLVHGA